MKTSIGLHNSDGNISIENESDVKYLIESTNDLHDAYLMSADYRAYVRSNQYTTVSSEEGESLVIRYLVTSLPELPVVELTFLNVIECTVKQKDIVRISVSFSTPFITFSSDNGTLVTARHMYWKIIDRPGLRLQRGGTKDAIWYVIPGLLLPMNERLDDYTQIVAELAETVPNAKIYHTGSSRPLPCIDAAFTTDHIHSFRSPSTVYTMDGTAFCWYPISDREALTEAVSRLDHGNPLSGNMIAICDDDGMVFTVELIERGYFNMVICSRRGNIPRNGFCGGKYYVEPYSGGGMEELS